MAQPNQPAIIPAAVQSAMNRAGPFLDWAKPINRLPGPVANAPTCFNLTNANRNLWTQLTNKANNPTGQGINLVVPDGDASPARVNAFLTALGQGMEHGGVGPVVVNREIVGQNQAGLINLMGSTVGPTDFYHAGEAANKVVANKRGTFWLVATKESDNPNNAFALQDLNAQIADTSLSAAQRENATRQRQAYYLTNPYSWHDVAVLVWKSKTYIYNPSYPSANNTYFDGQTGLRRPEATGSPRVSNYWLLGGVSSLLDRLNAGNRVNTAVAAGNILIGGGGNVDPLDHCRTMSLIWIARIGAIVTQIDILEAKGANRTQQDDADLAQLLYGFGQLTRVNSTPNSNAPASQGLWTAIRRA